MRLPESAKYLATAVIPYTIEICPLGEKHPNTYKISLTNENEYRELVAICLRSGIIETMKLVGFQIHHT